jgi:hypothetical protein
MKNPQLGQLVWAETLDGTFEVVALHPHAGLADLRSSDGSHAMKMQIPFAVIHPVGGDLSPISSD